MKQSRIMPALAVWAGLAALPGVPALAQLCEPSVSIYSGVLTQGGRDQCGNPGACPPGVSLGLLQKHRASAFAQAVQECTRRDGCGRGICRPEISRRPSENCTYQCEDFPGPSYVCTVRCTIETACECGRRGSVVPPRGDPALAATPAEEPGACPARP